jgi:hypothetical protein
MLWVPRAACWPSLNGLSCAGANPTKAANYDWLQRFVLLHWALTAALHYAH